MSKKYKRGNFTQISRDIFKENLSYKAKWLYVILCELEHRFTDHNGKDDFFFRTLKDISKDSGMKPQTVIKYRKELIDSGWISTGKMHWIDKKTGKRSEKHVTSYLFLRE